MKKILYMFLSLAVLSTACDPNEELYAELDAAVENVPQADLELTLSDDDYALAIPDDDKDGIGKYKNFGSEEEAKELVPNILSGLYPHLGGKSLANVTYKVYRPYSYRNAEEYTVTDEDYESVGGNTAKYKNFSNEADVLSFLTNKFTNATHGKTISLTYKFYENRETVTKTKNFIFLDDAWRAPYELGYSDYDLLQNQYNNFDNKDELSFKMPTFMDQRFPYAKEGDKMAVEYTWYWRGDVDKGEPKHNTEDRVIFLAYDGSDWSIIGNTVNRTLQFGYEKTVWVADNTLKYTLLVDDFVFIGETFPKASGDIDNYKNINMGKYSEEEVITYLDAVLKKNFPDAKVGQKYLVSFATYNPRGTAERHLILNAEGNYVIKE